MLLLNDRFGYKHFIILKKEEDYATTHNLQHKYAQTYSHFIGFFCVY